MYLYKFMGASLQLLFDTSGAKASNAKWLASDLQVGDIMKFLLVIAVSSSSVIQITKNGGVDWVSINSGLSINAQCEYTFDVHVKAGDLFNVRTNDPAGTNIIWFRLIKSTTEG